MKPSNRAGRAEKTGSAAPASVSSTSPQPISGTGSCPTQAPVALASSSDPRQMPSVGTCCSTSPRSQSVSPGSQGNRSSWSGCMNPPKTSTASYASSGGGLPDSKLQSSRRWPDSATRGPNSSGPASSPCTMERTFTGARLRSAARRDPVHVEEPAELLRVGRRLRDAAERVVGILRRCVVVEEGVGLLGLARELAQRPDPLLELLVGVEVVEALGRRAAALVPGPEVATVEADVRGR